MSNKEEKIPNIRFKDFEDVWKKINLNELANFSKGKGYTKKDLKPNGKEIILYGRLYTNYQTEISIVDTFVESDDGAIKSEHGDVIVPGSGESSKDISRASVVNKSGVILGGDLNIIKTKKEKLLPIFLARTISNGSQQKELIKRAQGKSVVHLRTSDLMKVIVTMPQIEEQKKIGAFFQLLDYSITLFQREYDLLSKTKQSYLHKMFVNDGDKVPKIRFEGFSDDWKELKFSNIFEKSSVKNSENKFCQDKVISVSKMKWSDRENNSSDIYMQTYNVLQKGSIAFEGNKSKNHMFGRFVLNDIGDGIVSHVFNVFDPIIYFDFSFMKEYINNESVMRSKLMRSTTKTLMMTTLNTKEILKQKILLPSDEEQEKIGLFLNELDNAIILNEYKIKQLNEMKKIFLRKMFV